MHWVCALEHVGDLGREVVSQNNSPAANTNLRSRIVCISVFFRSKKLVDRYCRLHAHICYDMKESSLVNGYICLICEN
jgi:hypothetical protein